MPQHHRKRPKVDAQRIKATERQRQALELRKAGATYEHIAKELGYRGRAGAAVAITSAMRKTIQEPADDVRRIDLERLNSWLVALQPKIRTGDALSIQTGLRIMERRAKLLGLDQPIKIDASLHAKPITEYSDEELAQLMAQGFICQHCGKVNEPGKAIAGLQALAQGNIQ